MKASVSYYVTDNASYSQGYDPVADLDGKWTLDNLLQFTKGALLKVSEDVLKEEQARGFDKNPVVVVDNKFNRPIESVHPLGKIEFVAKQDLREIILFSYDAIVRRSPIGSEPKPPGGRYTDVNVVVFNGKEVARNMTQLEAWLNSNPPLSDRDIIRFVNTAPYARKLERWGISRGRRKMKQESNKAATRKGRGRTFGRMAVKIPNGAYVLAYRSIANKYKKNSFIKFDMITGDKLGLTGEGRTFKIGKGKGRPYLYPSIIIRAISAGLTDRGYIQ